MRDVCATVSVLQDYYLVATFICRIWAAPKRKEGPKDLTHRVFHLGLAWSVLKVPGNGLQARASQKSDTIQVRAGRSSASSL